jgi:hypothetical protein
VYEDYPYLLAEMYAYSMAAAHEKLPHLQVDNYMVSSSDAGGEAWPHVDGLPQVCIPPDENGESLRAYILRENFISLIKISRAPQSFTSRLRIRV